MVVGKNINTADKICSIIDFLDDNIFVKFRGCLFCQVIGIPTGMYCTPLITDLVFFYSYEGKFVDSLVRSGHRRPLGCLIFVTGIYM